MRRRDFLKAAAATSLAAPSLALAAGQRVLKFTPQADLSVLDPIWTTATVTRNHAFLVFDTLYGQDNSYQAVPQMAEGATTENDGKLWKITLRPGLKFHDGSAVLAKDCVASIQRWGKRDSFGQTLLAATDELSAPDDKTIQFRLKRKFPLLPDALAKCTAFPPVIMPERLAKTDAFTQVTEMVGSGPYKFVAAERMVGTRCVYERNADYKPRENGTPQWTSGPKIVNFDRVEWVTIPDTATAASALQTGEIDWLEQPSPDLQPMLAKGQDDHRRQQRSDRGGRHPAHEPAGDAVRQPCDPARHTRRGQPGRLHDRGRRQQRFHVEDGGRSLPARQPAREQRRHGGPQRPSRLREGQARPRQPATRARRSSSSASPTSPISRPKAMSAPTCSANAA